jgi:hypothetical protein
VAKRYTVAVLTVLALGLVAPASAWAQIAPSPPWGEPINTPDRFVVLASYNDEAVYDQETGLVWERSPATDGRNWPSVHGHCNTRTVGTRKGWRAPTIQEVASLVDPTQTNPALPAGHPFNVQSLLVWSATADDRSPNAWFVEFHDGRVDSINQAFSLVVWCVRGGQGVNPQ